MPQSSAIQRRCCRFRTEEIGSSDLRSGRAQCECGGDATSIGNPTSGYDRHANSIGHIVFIIIIRVLSLS